MDLIEGKILEYESNLGIFRQDCAQNIFRLAATWTFKIRKFHNYNFCVRRTFRRVTIQLNLFHSFGERIYIEVFHLAAKHVASIFADIDGCGIKRPWFVTVQNLVKTLDWSRFQFANGDGEIRSPRERISKIRFHAFFYFGGVGCGCSDQPAVFRCGLRRSLRIWPEREWDFARAPTTKMQSSRWPERLVCVSYL